MAKAKKKGKGGAAKAAAPPEPAAYRSAFSQRDAEPARLLAAERGDHVDVELRLLVDWPYANLRFATRTACSLDGVVRRVEERHGHVARLKVYRDPPNAANEVRDFALTLADLGVRGGPRDRPGKAVLYYDFRPVDHGPLILREPNLVERERDASAAAAAARGEASGEAEAGAAAAAAASPRSKSPRRGAPRSLVSARRY